MTPARARRPRALVAFGDAREREAVVEALSARFDVAECADGAALLAALGPPAPDGLLTAEAPARADLVVTAATLPVPGAPPLDAVLALRQRDPFLPAIVLVDADDRAARAAATSRGALAVVERPVDAQVIASWANVARACFAPEPIDLTAPLAPSTPKTPPVRIRPRRGPAAPPQEPRVRRRAGKHGP